MNTIIKPGASILFMKVGTHAQEPIEDIIARKSKEIKDTGFAMWGYGGNTCHPQTMVQPFAEDSEQANQPIYLCMQEMNSRHFAEPLLAKEYSSDGIRWKEVPPTIQVRGSRFALVINKLRQEKFTLPLDKTSVAVGISRGKVGSRYVQGQVDKACLTVSDERERGNEPEKKEVEISYVAELATPYAVYLRGNR